MTIILPSLLLGLWFVIYKGVSIYYNLFMLKRRSYAGLVGLILAYPVTHFLVQYIPNPLVPHANLAMNMIFPVLAGYFYGPLSGAFAGMLGTGISAVLVPDVYDALAILPHTFMGLAAGIAGNSQKQFLAALSILVGHMLNILFFWRLGEFVIENVSTLILGLITETTIDMVAIILLIVLLQKIFYVNDEQRW
ncbi:MAG TPA: hypothetical protein PK414_01095 [Anaerolineales bacterium]|nr:hypothetical protein [Anaerolineales bacterium]